VIGGGLLAKAARLGRMVVEDAADLGMVFARVATWQARDALTEARRRAQRPAAGARDSTRR
jgi:hypothetical protein